MNAAASSPPEVGPLFEWLVDGGPGALGPAAIVKRVGDDLLAAGVPVCRIVAFVRTLHPHIMGRSFTWRPGVEVEVAAAPYAILQSAEFARSPVAAVFRTAQPLRRRLVDGATRGEFAVLDRLADEGVTDYLALPMVFLSGQVHCVAFATAAPDGFTDAQVEAVTRIVRPLARVAEIMAQGRTAANLLSTYVGRGAGDRIIAGNIQRGDTESIRSVLWFSDLRDFTALAASMEPVALIGVLNDLFECQVPAIERHGGEVLKFMGDGLFAIFPVADDAATVGELCDAALDAATDARLALEGLNRARGARGQDPVRFGLALHVGDVAFGNIGGASRLDFTCIGPAVNVAARLESLTRKVERPVVVSAEFAARTTRKTERLGRFELKGVAEPQEVFAPAGDGPLAAW